MSTILDNIAWRISSHFPNDVYVFDRRNEEPRPITMDDIRNLHERYFDYSTIEIVTPFEDDDGPRLVEFSNPDRISHYAILVYLSEYFHDSGEDLRGLEFQGLQHLEGNRWLFLFSDE